MKKIYQIPLLRRLILPILNRISFTDITIRHHWTKDKFTLHPFKHKGYWYHGKQRELETMLLFSDLIRKGDFVIEIGGHIGYISLHFAQLVGDKGHVIIFEPGPNNLPYIRKNTKSKICISLMRKAVTDYAGTAKFYIDNLTGQNNSLFEKYDVLERNKHFAFVNSINVDCIEVPCTDLDDFLLQCYPTPSLIKIDIEGAELSALNGMKDTLEKDGIVIMIEVSENASNVFSLLREAGFHMFRPNKSSLNDHKEMKGNIFCVKDNDDRIRVFQANKPS